MEVLGIDVGFGFTKATNGKESLIFKSLIGNASEITFRTNIGNSSFANNLHITIDDNSYFIGEFAEQQSNARQFTLDQNTLIADSLKILALTAAGSFSENFVPLNVISGLPVGYLKQYYKRFTEILQGQHAITYHKPNGTKIQRKININKVRMMPQPLGSVFNMLMNDTGKIVNKKIARQKVGVIDIGFRTTDVTILDQLRFVDRGSGTMDTGISKSYGMIAKKLQEDSGVNIELYRLYKAVEKGSISIRGKEYDIQTLKQQVYSHFAATIAGDVERLWAEDWDIETIILTGGGSMELGPYLQPLIAGNVVLVENNQDARLNNVMGYLKYGKYEWGEYAPEPEAKPPESNQRA